MKPKHTRPRPRRAAVSPTRPDSKQEAAYDAELVRRLQKGEAAAFEEIVRRHRDRLFVVAVSCLRDRHDAEEIVQDAFVRAHRSIQRFRGDCSLATWLHRITLNLARNRYWYFRRRARHVTCSMELPLGEKGEVTIGDLFAAPGASQTGEEAQREFQELVTTCMERLAEPHREILTMRNLLNQSYGEIAKALGIEEGTVKSRLARARGCLRLVMAAECPDFGENAEPREWLELRPDHPSHWLKIA